MTIKLIYFAWVRERIGKPEETVEVPVTIATISDLIAWLKTRGEEYEYAFENAPLIRTAIDKVHTKHDMPIASAREIAFFPPMTGG
jgi:sulfur-carrier protein